MASFLTVEEACYKVQVSSTCIRDCEWATTQLLASGLLVRTPDPPSVKFVGG
ncbi:MAG: hypothetical protein JRF64_03810 [Deltaproteobacteria bacterium]|nr:hypothetical protein [Deltaproteobacteria bacterium]